MHARHLKPTRQRPEDAYEGDKQEYAVEQAARQVDGDFRGDAYIFCDAPIRIGVIAGDEVRLVMTRIFHPVADDPFGQPAPPIEL